MLWFIISCVIYFVVIAALVAAVHKAREKMMRDKEPIPEEELINLRQQARLFTRRGVLAPNQSYNGAKKSSLLFVFFLMIFIFAAIGAPCLVVWLVKRYSVPAGFTRLSADLFVLPYLTAAAFGFSVCYCLPFIFRKSAKAFEALNKSPATIHNPNKSVYIFRIIVLLTFIITFPFFALGLNYNASYNDHEIRYNPFFSYKQVITTYEEVSSINRYFSRDNNGNISSMHYIITLNDGYTIDTLFGEPTLQTYEIHGYLKAKNPALFDNLITDVPQEDIIKFLQKEYDKEAFSRVFFIFDLDY